MKNLEAKVIADEFNSKYERLWNEYKINELSNLYLENAILIGYKTIVGQSFIAELLQNIYDQGWSKIQIKTKEVIIHENIILVANEYQAIGSGQKNGEILEAKSSHTLIQRSGNWITAMHTITS